jgi:hypothetical protein
MSHVSIVRKYEPGQSNLSTVTGNFVTQREAAHAIGVSPTWLCLRGDSEFYGPAIRLDGSTPRYHAEQIRLWLSVAAGNQTPKSAKHEWQMIRQSIGRASLADKIQVRRRA